MINCILFNNGKFEEIKTKNIEESNIYKKCNFKNIKDFEKLFTWNQDEYIIELWGKNKGNIIKNIPKLFSSNNISIYSKSIFVKKDINNKFISLNIDNFNTFFNINKQSNLNHDEELNNVNNNINNNVNNNVNNNEHDNEDDDNEDDEDSISNNEENDLEDSELSYEIYCYSDEE